MKKLIVILAAVVLIGPMIGLVGVGALMNPATTAAACTTDDSGGGSVEVGDVPDSLTATTRDGTQITLDKKQLTHAATIIQIGNKTDGVGPDGITVALMAALTESSLRMLANTGTYPESGDYPNDGNGSDHDSLGLFQMRPQSGWGSVKDLMDPEYQARAFFGGPDGPNYPSPRGLLDIPGWEDMSKGEAAQSVEVSAFPDRYANYEPVAEKIIDALRAKSSSASAPSTAIPAGSSAPAAAAGTKRESGVVFPLPEGVWVQTDDFGPRIDPINGEATTHSGIDLAAPDGTEILAAADGTVTLAQYTDSGGGHIVIEHHLDGGTVATGYVHMWENGIHVSVGDHVKAGQHIADVGSSGHSTGPHLHFEVRQGGTDGEYTDPAAWLNDHDAADLPESEVTPAEPDSCDADNGGEGKTPGGFDGDPDELVDDPTTEGQITARMAFVMAQTQDAFPDTSWSCYSPRSGTKSEHPLGRACDITFGNQIGSRPTPAQLEDGWKVTNWVKDHAETLGVQYLIWQGTIWNIDRDDEGWRDYNGGGMHDPSDITGGHYDHLHITVKEGN